MNANFNILFWEYDFYRPQALWLLLLVPTSLFLLWFFKRKYSGQLLFARSKEEQASVKAGNVWIFEALMYLFYGLSLAILIVCFARPYHEKYDPPKIDYKNGIDIILSIDASGSMLAADFEPNRLEAAKRVAQEFVDTRKGDRVGLVVYEGEAYTACPATLDYEMLKEQIGLIEPEQLEGGTAVGNGLAVAVTRLRSDSLKSKVIILITDGSNNAGTIEPLEAAELAKTKNCKVYTIGMGSTGLIPTPVQTPFGIEYQNLPSDLDENTLKNIADITGGKYFRASDDKSLKAIYADIDKMETRKMEANQTGANVSLRLFPFFFYAFLFFIGAQIIQRLKFRLDE